ncbi:UDP-N-acetylmuramoyl-L-alanine--D-glutamate ligase [bacterium]|nr:UDP-N-acetylmuramoyl-L-alanine--D-glutamate ligase [bacterium]
MIEQIAFAGKNVGILGLARSGLQAALLMKRVGAIPFVSDRLATEEIQWNAKALEAEGINYEIGGHSPKLYEDKDIIILSPGISLESPIIKEIRAKKPGVAIISEIEAAYQFCEGKIIAVTGSNGKSTTVSLIGELLKNADLKTFAGGNLGNPFSSFVLDTTEDSYVVLEVSSFQMETIKFFKPWISVILNLTPDHLDRYSSVDEYYSAKLRVFENQDENDYLVLNDDDLEIKERINDAKPARFYYSRLNRLERGVFSNHKYIHFNLSGEELRNLMPIEEVGLKGPHNLWNVMASVSVCLILDLDLEVIRDTLREFKGIEHRLEEVGKINGVLFVNDSKATNVDSVAYALQSYPNNIVLILGGLDKGSEFEKLSEHISGKVSRLILLGKAKDKIAKALSGTAPIEFVGTMKEAVRKGYNAALETRQGNMPNEIVMLSPGCASFDMYKNFEYRGYDFKEQFKSLKDEIEG